MKPNRRDAMSGIAAAVAGLFAAPAAPTRTSSDPPRAGEDYGMSPAEWSEFQAELGPPLVATWCVQDALARLEAAHESCDGCGACIGAQELSYLFVFFEAALKGEADECEAGAEAEQERRAAAAHADRVYEVSLALERLQAALEGARDRAEPRRGRDPWSVLYDDAWGMCQLVELHRAVWEPVEEKYMGDAAHEELRRRRRPYPRTPIH